MDYMSLFKDTNARIPFSILGILLLLGSSTTTVVLSTLGNERSEVFIEIHEAKYENVLISATADIENIINNAGLNAARIIGRKPVIISQITGLDAHEVNLLRIRSSIAEELHIYLQENYKNNMYNDGTYALNIGNQNDPSAFLVSSDDIKIEPVIMKIHRPFSVFLLGPEQKKNAPVYWKISLDLPVMICSIHKYERPKEYLEVLSCSTLITSRLPLLENLVYEYNQTINGLGPFWNLITLISNTYTIPRGYKHYRSGSPENIMKNSHLAPIINGCLLFEEGLVFGSVDPYALVHLIASSKKALSNKHILESDIIKKYDVTDFSISFDEFTEICTNIDTGEPVNTSIDTCPYINLTEIAQQLLFNWTEAILTFENTHNTLYQETISSPTTDTITQLIEEKQKQDHTFLTIQKGNPTFNSTTKNLIQDICSTIYSAVFSIDVQRDIDPTIFFGDHSGFPVDNGTTVWEITSITKTGYNTKPDKGFITPEVSLYSEQYTIQWERNHQWTTKKTIMQQNVTQSIWETNIVKDIKIEKNVSFSILLKEYGRYKERYNDVLDIFYRNNSLHDTNLVETLDVYNTTVFQPQLPSLYTAPSGEYHLQNISGDIPEWVESEAWMMIINLSKSIGSITQNETITSSKYPDPVVLIEKIKDDIRKQYTALLPDLMNHSQYIQNNSFFSLGKKAVFCIREWYVHLVETQYTDAFNTIGMLIDEQINDSLSTLDGPTKNQLHESLNTNFQEAIGDQLIFHLGTGISLESTNQQLTSWNENITIAVKHIPSYLDPFESVEYEGKKEYFLGIKNICTLGSTGFPLLPITPTTPWLATFNLWIVQIRGSYAEFTVFDVNGESHPHPLFGYEPVVYTRKYEAIRTDAETLLGWNTRVTVSCDTVAFSLVPAWGFMVGELPNELIEHDGKMIT